MPSISQHISPNLISLGRTSIIYAVTDIVFSLKQNIPPSGELLFRSIIITPPESWPIEICCISSRLGAGFIARPLAWSHGAPVRQLSFYGPVSVYLGIQFLFFFQGAREADLVLSFLIWEKSKASQPKNQKNFLSFAKMAFLRLLIAC